MSVHWFISTLYLYMAFIITEVEKWHRTKDLFCIFFHELPWPKNSSLSRQTYDGHICILVGGFSEDSLILGPYWNLFESIKTCQNSDSLSIQSFKKPGIALRITNISQWGTTTELCRKFSLRKKNSWVC